MGQTIKAPLLYRQREPMGVEDIEVEDPQEGEVKVKMTASGVCHSCLHAADGSWDRFDDAMPMVLGDEGAGVVEEVGAGVHSVQPGDHVVLSWSPSCGLCRHCVIGKPALCLNRPSVGRILGGHTRFRWQGKPAYHFGATGTYAPVTVIHHSQAIKISDDVPLETAALIGCSVTTGVGAVLNTAQVPAGAPIAVWGAGGIGLNVIQGGVVCGAWPIIAVDIDSRKLGLAEEFGATHVVDASKEGSGRGGYAHHRRRRRLHVRRGWAYAGGGAGLERAGEGRTVRGDRPGSDRRQGGGRQLRLDHEGAAAGRLVLRYLSAAKRLSPLRQSLQGRQAEARRAGYKAVQHIRGERSVRGPEGRPACARSDRLLSATHS